MVDQARARRLAKRITQIVADALEHEVKDPRLAMVTITDTRVTGDLREATVYYTVLGETVDADAGHRGRRRRAGQRHRGAALAGRGGHRHPAHAVAGVRARLGAGRGAPDGGAAGPHPGVGRRGGAARRRGAAGRRPRPVPGAARADRGRTDAAVAVGPCDRASAARSTRTRTHHERASVSGPVAAAAELLAEARRRHAAGARAARRRLAGQRAGTGHRAAPARGRGPGVLRDARTGCPRRCARSTCTGWWCRRTGCRAAPEVLVACDAAEPARLGALVDRLDTRRHLDHDRPPRVQPRFRRRPAARPDARGHRGAGAPACCAAMGAAAGPPTWPAASTRAWSPTRATSAARGSRRTGWRPS